MKFNKLIMVGVVPLCWAFSGEAAGAENAQIETMQKVIDQQQQEIKAQREQLDAQRQRLDEQDSRLEALQSQLEMLVSGQSQPAEENPAMAGTVDAAPEPEVAGTTEATPPVEAAEGQPDTGKSFMVRSSGELPGAAESFGVLKRRTGPLSINDPHLLLDHHPLDVPDDRGIFIYSRDKENIFRIYGSLRGLAVYDNRQNFHAYDLDIPKVPVGVDDVKDWNSDWTINTTKLGFQMGVHDYFGVRAEFDWKGAGDDALRIRHMYMRAAHWLVGKHWTALNTLNFLPLSVDSHSTSAHLGSRAPQVKYLGGEGDWSWQASIEYFQPKFNDPGIDASAGFELIDVKARNLLPYFVGNVTYRQPWGMTRLAAGLTQNRVRYLFAEQERATSSETGIALMAGVKVAINEKNTLKAHIQRTDGNVQLGPDFSYQRYDMAFNPNTGRFENLKAWGAQMALEHQWTPTLISAIGGGWMEMDNRSYQPGSAFSRGYKGLVNLFYRPGGWLKGMAVAGELEFAGQKTLDGSRGDTTRISVLVLYNF